MSLHYELTNESKTLCDGTVVHRIRATRDLPHLYISAGDLGGWIESTDNLSGGAWVADEAIVYGRARVFDQALVAQKAHIFREACVFDQAQVYGKAKVSGEACVYDGALVYGEARVFGKALVHGEASVHGQARVFDSAQVFEDAEVLDEAKVHDTALVHGDTRVNGQIRLSHAADVTYDGHYLHCTVQTDSLLDATLFRTRYNGHRVKVGCWSGTLDDLEELALSDQWIETVSKESIEESRPELLAMCQFMKARVARWS